MGIFSFLKKKQPKQGDIFVHRKMETEDVDESNLVDAEEVKQNVKYQETPLTLTSKCSVLSKGFPCDYFFPGDANNQYAEMPLLTPLKINIAKVLESGVPGKQKWEGSNCFAIEESDEYLFYNYACYSDGSGGCNIRQSKTKPKEVVFFGKSRMFSCIFHDYLVQVDRAGRDLFLYVKDIHSAKEKIYPCFGTKKDSSGAWDRYTQDQIQSIKVDQERDAIIIRVRRSFCQFSDPTDPEYICNADTQYTMVVKYINGEFYIRAEYPELNITQVFENNI